MLGISRTLTHKEVEAAARALLIKIKARVLGSGRGYSVDRPLRLYGVPRGGACAALWLKAVTTDMYHITLSDSATECDMIVDDLIDSGRTMMQYELSQVPFATLFTKRPHELSGITLPSTQWVVFPWEGDESSSADDIPVRLLQYIGEDPDRGGLKETPARFLKAWKEWTRGYGADPAAELKCFEDGAESYDQMILVKDIPVWSNCEHHMCPFFGKAHVAYVPGNGRIVGLSKLCRLVDIFARRLQVQERLTNQIADAIQENLKAVGVGVILECRHTCMESRGVNREGVVTTSSAMRGVMLTKPEARSEMLTLIGRS